MPSSRPIYFDCNATTPIHPDVRAVMIKSMEQTLGNAGSRTHVYGTEAAKAVRIAREQVSAVVRRMPEEVIFTSGATESNNLAILGLARHGGNVGKRHIVSTQIEHKAVLEPLAYLEAEGFEVTLVPPVSAGYVEAGAILREVRQDTLLVSVMHVNNETGVIQPLEAIANELGPGPVLHTDAAQGFGKDLERLTHQRLDLISISGHKVYGPKGVGALIAGRSVQKHLQPRQLGGGQERGLRAGTLPTFLVAALGAAAEIAARHHKQWAESCLMIKNEILAKLSSAFDMRIHGGLSFALPNTINFSIPGIDSEALIVCLRELIAISNGSACTSGQIAPSHVLAAMGVSLPEIEGAVRLSWQSDTVMPDMDEIVSAIEKIL